MWLTLSTAKSFTLVSSWLLKKPPREFHLSSWTTESGGRALRECDKVMSNSVCWFLFSGGERVFRRLVSASVWNWCDQQGVYKKKNAWWHTEEHMSRRVSEFNLRCRLAAQGHLNAKVMHQTDSWSVGEKKREAQVKQSDAKQSDCDSKMLLPQSEMRCPNLDTSQHGFNSIGPTDALLSVLSD